MTEHFRHLALTFGPRSVALASANGTPLRYEVSLVARAHWGLTIDAGGSRRTRDYRTERRAKSAARDDFRRRQLLRAA